MGMLQKWAEKTRDRIYSFRVPDVGIIQVHRHINFDKDQWLVSCLALGVNNKKLVAKDIEDAMHEALQLIDMQINKIHTAFKLGLINANITL